MLLAMSYQGSISPKNLADDYINEQDYIQYIKRFNSGIYYKIIKNENLDILIAGCGTGQHAIEESIKFKNSNLVAIDLSFKSLSFAKRKTNELGIDNIEYLQGDILDLEKLQKNYDLIESSGVYASQWNIQTGDVSTY